MQQLDFFMCLTNNFVYLYILLFIFLKNNRKIYFLLVSDKEAKVLVKICKRFYAVDKGYHKYPLNPNFIGKNGFKYTPEERQFYESAGTHPAIVERDETGQHHGFANASHSKYHEQPLPLIDDHVCPEGREQYMNELKSTPLQAEGFKRKETLSPTAEKAFLKIPKIMQKRVKSKIKMPQFIFFMFLSNFSFMKRKSCINREHV